jgi:hypothetical protein
MHPVAVGMPLRLATRDISGSADKSAASRSAGAATPVTVCGYGQREAWRLRCVGDGGAPSAANGAAIRPVGPSQGRCLSWDSAREEDRCP